MSKEEQITAEDTNNAKKVGAKNPKAQVSFSQLLRYATGYDYVLMAAGTISGIINGSTLPVMTILFGDIMTAIITFTLVAPPGTPNVAAFQDAQKRSLDSNVTDGVIKMCIVGTATFVFSYIQMTCWSLVGENQTKRIREKYFESLMSQDIGWFDNIETGDLTNRLSSDMTIIQEGLSDKVGLMIQFTSAFLAGFVIGYIKGWKLALVLTSTLPVLAGAAMIMAALIGGQSTEQQAEYAGAGAVAQQTLTAIKTVVAFGGEEIQTKRYCEKLDEAERTGVKKAMINGVGVGSIQLLFFLVYSLAFWYGNKLVPDMGSGGSGELTVGQVLNVIFAIIIGAFSLGNATPHIAALGSARGAAKIVFDTIDRVSPIDPLSDSGEKPSSVKGNVEFKDIVFRYPKRPDVLVVKGISVNIEAGKTVALVGASGSGKSTIIKLLERFYDPSEGTVYLDGIDIKKLNVNWLRSQIGIVSQEPILFNTTIRENILLGLDKRDLPLAKLDELIENVCRQANCWDFIQKLPQKMDTNVGEAGAMMSGGQKQRISIARAIIKNPAILLLDEATSALDTESERIVQAALENASKNRTTIVIAHRLSTIKNADRIIVMDNGNIVEQGNHSELLDLNGMYAKLVEGQQLKQLNESTNSQDTEVENGSQEVKDEVVFTEKKATKGGDVVVLKLEKEEKEKPYSVPYRRLFAYNKKEYPIFVLG